MNETEAAKLALRLAGAYPGRNIQEAHIKAWAEWLLEHEDQELAIEALEDNRANNASPPSIAELNATVSTKLFRRQLEQRQLEREMELERENAKPPLVVEKLPPGPHMTFAEYLDQNPEMRDQLDKVVKRA